MTAIWRTTPIKSAEAAASSSKPDGSRWPAVWYRRPARADWPIFDTRSAECSERSLLRRDSGRLGRGMGQLPRGSARLPSAHRRCAVGGSSNGLPWGLSEGLRLCFGGSVEAVAWSAGATFLVQALEQPSACHGRHGQWCARATSCKSARCSSVSRRLNIRLGRFGRLTCVPGGYGSVASASTSRARASLVPRARSAHQASSIVLHRLLVSGQVAPTGRPRVHAMQLAVEVLGRRSRPALALPRASDPGTPRLAPARTASANRGESRAGPSRPSELAADGVAPRLLRSCSVRAQQPNHTCRARTARTAAAPDHKG